MLQTATNSGVLPLSGGRSALHHGYSMHTLARKRFRENTSALAVTVGFVLPALNGVNKQLDKHVDAGTDVSMDELLQIFAKSGKDAAALYADRMARIACQTGLACALIESKSAYCNAAVYLWDLYPRLHQRYVGAVLSWLRIPVFVSSLLGPHPTTQDVAFLQARVSGVCALEDSLRRDTITLFGDLLVDTARILIRRDVDNPSEAIARQAVLRVTVTLVGAVGAGVGRAAAGERGEYWGNIAGVMAGPAVAVQLWTAIRKMRMLRPRRSVDAAKSHRHRHSASEGSKAAAATTGGVPATAKA
ncbi:conserved hypothetical protein [Leishmania mexicana MHOM/GT/2001/U1103]|uniref:Uncharacterized protein n=1 Tax=Leishmania mexicana (strain MHOM/GT/2001/U1103) TaxID=929439 RepID=E9AKY9_LEIMU|nr:conserved hypothetical protein [Leishmania mexicana MHOM/GT/2001/U1103]CBZ23592.1 conserved hypothetical protein [Leishmania mexicana MHOM/GT/2001/U1103]